MKTIRDLMTLKSNTEKCSMVWLQKFFEGIKQGVSFNPYKRVLYFFLVTVALSACGKKDVPYKDRPVEDIYNEAYDKLLKGDYEDAGRLFDETERQHPYSEWATRAQLMSTYSHFMAHKYGDASTAVESFIQLHPGHKDIDYAYYMKGMIDYEQIPIVQRDQQITLDALKTFENLTRRFPNSKYARAARPKIELIRDHLAGKEMFIARFYMKKEAYIAALGRLEKVIKDYDRTTHIPEALHRLVECYVALGLETEAQRIAAILGYNFPGSPWYADSYYLLKKEDYRLPHHQKENLPWYKKIL